MLGTFSDVLFGSLFRGLFWFPFAILVQGWRLIATRADPELGDYDIRLFCSPTLLKGVFSAGYRRKVISEPENGVRLGQIPGPRELDNFGGPLLAGLPRILSRSMASSPNSKCQLHSTYLPGIV